MKRVHLLTSVAGVAVCAAGAYGQIIAFNGPMPWITQRNDSITVRAQIDTAQLKKNKSISLSAVLVNERMQKSVLARKSFPVTDYSGEFALGVVKKNLVGGRSYIKIDWSLPAAAGGKGSLEPVGIAALDKLPAPEVIAVPRLKEGASLDLSALKESDYRTVGATRFALGWNEGALFIVLVRKQAAGSVRFAIDGKNGKNAFLSFADRVVMYEPAKDSLRGAHFSREMREGRLAYEEKPWPNEITKSVADDRVVIRVPWYDAGIIQFAERRLGMGIAAFDAKGGQTAAWPAKADFYLPATWCDLVLAK
ncbi:MAG: hypothetical protein JW699_01930 [Chitinispirillaceae bacterium]|nr:hypothetical protein [Chitinispirillaceae bacterium]